MKGRTSAVSLLQMASYSGRCVLVRLQPFRGGQQALPLSLMEVLRDPRVLKVGVGCYEDGKRLTRDYGLSLGCTLDLRYLALRQKYAHVLPLNPASSSTVCVCGFMDGDHFDPVETWLKPALCVCVCIPNS